MKKKEKTWYKAPGTYIAYQDAVIKMCLEKFGPMLDKGLKKSIDGKNLADNHGNWDIQWWTGKIQFRYEKDLVLFILLAGHLVDQFNKGE